MTDRITKFLNKLDAPQRAKLRAIITAIAANKLAGFDVKPLAGRKGWFRCRSGKIRIIFVRTSAGKHIIYSVDFRGNVYK